MIQITKELAEAVVALRPIDGGHGPDYCAFCCQLETYPDWKIEHTPECIVVRAKLLLELEWGIKS